RIGATAHGFRLFPSSGNKKLYLDQDRPNEGQNRPAPGTIREDGHGTSAGISAASWQKPEWDQLPNAAGDRTSELRIAMQLPGPDRAGSATAGHPHQQRAITAPQPKTWRSSPRCDVELMTEKEVLGFKPAPRPEQIGDIRSK